MSKEKKGDESNDRINRFNEYHTFQMRNSYMDVLIEKTKINESEFKGFYNMVMSMLIIYVLTLPIFNYLNFGYLVKTEMVGRMINDLSILIFVWPLFHFWTYLAYLLQIMILKGFPKWICFIFENTTHLGIFIVTTYICINSDMYTGHLLFTVFQCVIHFFKMHSYTQTNRDFREDYLRTQKTGEKPISSYPNNITFSNFFYFLRAPTFVYEESYPRTPSFRLSYFVLKLLKAIFILILLYYIFTEHIEPLIPFMNTLSIVELIIKLYFPIAIFCLSLFYMLFECVLLGYAELATFGDRQFYDDWWNSTDLEEFNRRWNKIVHAFLYRHVYLECNRRYKISPSTSRIITFFVSALFHEYCLCTMIRAFRPVLSILMMFQLPLITLGKKYLRKTTAGNFFFWFSVLIGNSLAFILYNRAVINAHGITFSK